MAIEKFSQAVHYHIRSQIEGFLQNRTHECIIHGHFYIMPVCQFRNGGNV
jgi:hypothetical protein